MAIGVVAGGSRIDDEEARAEVEVLEARLKKTSQLTKRIQASLARLEDSGKSLGDAIQPLSNGTRKLQVKGRSRCILEAYEWRHNLLIVCRYR